MRGVPSSSFELVHWFVCYFFVAHYFVTCFCGDQAFATSCSSVRRRSVTSTLTF